jgi:hypothetical protein
VGHAGINTIYLGSRDSPRRIRIYRKDLQQVAQSRLCEEMPPTLRVEIELKKHHAASAFALYQTDEHACWSLAAGHLYAMTGVDLGDRAPVPAPPEAEDADAACTLFTLLDQYGAVMDALTEAGVDIQEGIAIHREHRSRHASKRAADRVEAWGSVDPAKIYRQVRTMFAARTAYARARPSSC